MIWQNHSSHPAPSRGPTGRNSEAKPFRGADGLEEPGKGNRGLKGRHIRSLQVGPGLPPSNRGVGPLALCVEMGLFGKPGLRPSLWDAGPLALQIEMEIQQGSAILQFLRRQRVFESSRAQHKAEARWIWGPHVGWCMLLSPGTRPRDAFA